MEPNQPKPVESTEPQDLAHADAQAFMASTGLKPSPPAPSGAPAGSPPQSPVVQVRRRRNFALYAVIGIFIVLAVLEIFSFVHGSSGSGSTANNPLPSTGLTLPDTPDPAATSGLSKQEQQDVNTCSNVVNAALSC